ncbi:MAG: hypothetical protein ACKV2O_23040 [Acidimicrobiales bacterium]
MAPSVRSSGGGGATDAGPSALPALSALSQHAPAVSRAVAPASTDADASSDAAQPPAPNVPASADKATTTTQLLDDVDAFVELLEERIMAQLERRGLRFRDLF